MEILISVIAKIAEYTVEPIGRELGYVCFTRANFKKLKTQVDKLKETRESVQHKVDTVKRNARDIKPVVEKWLEQVDDFVGKSVEILANEGAHGRLCSTNLVQRHKFSRKARKMSDEALEMKNEGDNFDTTSYEVGILLAQSSLPKVLDFLNFDSRKSTMEQIVDAIFDDNVHRIGVLGMGGVGKTMLLKEILRKIVENKSFGEVVILTVSQKPDLKNIQGELADKLGLKFEQETIEGRAPILRKRLKMEKSILVMLDDVWEYIDLGTIGIPSTIEEHTGCKILFTSRNTHLLSNEMCVNKMFEIKVLGDDESWKLFKTMAGEIVEACDVKPIAIQIVKECAGLPIAITTIAMALRNKPFYNWNDALYQLQRDDVVMSNIRGMNKKVYLQIKLSYNCLGYDEVQLLFLLCSLFPEDFNINVEELQVCAMAMGFLRGVDTMAKGRCRIKTLVDDLISSSLLLQSELGNDYVKMHDLVRDVAISIASENDHIRTLSYVKRLNEEWKEEKKLSGNYTAVSLIIQDYDNLDLPKLMLPEVRLFMLSGPKYGRHVWEDTCLLEMKQLQGLVLKAMRMSLSSSSLYTLGNIRVLRLHGCESVRLFEIGELKKLEILDLSCSDIVEIPTTISQLTQLKVFNLSSCYYLKVIPPNILSKLTKLEELSVETFDRWEGEKGYEGRENASLSELQYLPRLCALNLTIQDEKIMPKPLFSKEFTLENFNITIGCRKDTFFQERYNFFRTLDLVMKSGSCLDDWIKMLLKRSVSVCCRGPICLKDFYSQLLDGNDFSHLKHLFLYGSLFQHFIHEKDKPLRKCFPKLELLHLEMLENLKSVIHGYIGECPFNKLKTVKVKDCNKLKTLFFKCILDDVLNLEEIHIKDCKKMEVVIITVIENEEATNHIIEFTHLKSLILWNLPRLQKFCYKIEKLGQFSLDDLEVSETSTVSNNIGGSFFSEQVSLPNLEKLRIHDVDTMNMIWSNNVLVPNSFFKLKEVEISFCRNLCKVLFPPNMMSILASLNILRIRNCELLEGIFEVQELFGVTETTATLLPNLIELELQHLSELEYVWSKNILNFDRLVTFENIKNMFIQTDSELKGEYLWSIKTFKQLEKLRIGIRQLIQALGKEKRADTLESKQQLETSPEGCEIVQLQNGLELFPKLKSLTLYGDYDHSITELPMEIVEVLYQLEEFQLGEAFIEEIFSIQIPIPMKKQYETCKLLWRSLHLKYLPRLRNLWPECSQKNVSILQDLTRITIFECDALSSLSSSSSSSVAFTNLTSLTVQNCDGITHLLDPSVAKTLVKLKSLVLVNCKRMSSVIEGGADHEFVFNNLQILSIKNLTKLTSFYCGKCIIKFPSLIKVFIEECPKLKVFSHGIVSTPNLKNEDVHYAARWYDPEDREEIVGDMNVIITSRLNLEENDQFEQSPSDV